VLAGKTSLNERLAAAAMAGVPTTYRLPVLNGGTKARTVQVAIGEAARRVALRPGATREVELTLEYTGNAEADVRVGEDTYPLYVTAVPAPKDVQAAEFSGLWDAVDLRHSGGEIAPRADAMWGRAWRSPEPGEPQGHIVFGPYADVGKGTYVVAFRMMLETAGTARADERVVTLDINTGGYEGLGVQLGKTEVRADDLGEAGQWQWISVPVEWPGPPSLLETRVWWHGNVRVLVDRIAAFRLGRAITAKGQSVPR
jgi:hypothetical protein